MKMKRLSGKHKQGQPRSDTLGKHVDHFKEDAKGKITMKVATVVTVNTIT